jgi:hypothetical protein
MRKSHEVERATGVRIMHGVQILDRDGVETVEVGIGVPDRGGLAVEDWREIPVAELIAAAPSELLDRLS